MKHLRVATIVGLLLCGCGKSQAPPQIEALPITGTVTLDDKPLPGAEVVFQTPDSPAVFAATTKEDGTYQLQSLAGKANCKGKCKVTISRKLTRDGNPVPPGEPPANSGAVESLPQRYSQAAVTELSADVPEGGGKFDFPLKST
jgi:hypothetical protein